MLPIAIFKENMKLNITTDLLLGPSRSFGLTVLGKVEKKGERKRERTGRKEGEGERKARER